MRYIRTKNHVRRRLTLHHVETMRKARRANEQNYEDMRRVWDWIRSWHSGRGGVRPRADVWMLSRFYRNMIAARWEV
jgi:hypothetical protein